MLQHGRKYTMCVDNTTLSAFKDMDGMPHYFFFK